MPYLLEATMALLTRIRALFVLGLALLCACSAPIHIAQPVEVPTAGTWQVGLGLGASTSSGALDLLDQAESSGKDLAKSQWQCKDTQNRSDCLPAFRLRDGLRAAYGAGLAGLLDVNAEVSGLYGFGHGLAAGARLASSGQRVDVLWQFLGTPGSTGWLGTALVGYSHTTGGPPSVLAKVTELLQIPEGSRHSLHLGAQFGRRIGSIGWWQVGPHYLLSRHAYSLTPEVPILEDVAGQIVEGVLPNTDTKGWSHHVGGTVGLWLGYKMVYVGAELAVSNVMATTTILGKSESFSLIQVSPNLTALVRF